MSFRNNDKGKVTTYFLHHILVYRYYRVLRYFVIRIARRYPHLYLQLRCGQQLYFIIKNYCAIVLARGNETPSRDSQRNPK